MANGYWWALREFGTFGYEPKSTGLFCRHAVMQCTDGRLSQYKFIRLQLIIVQFSDAKGNEKVQEYNYSVRSDMHWSATIFNKA